MCVSHPSVPGIKISSLFRPTCRSIPVIKHYSGLSRFTAFNSSPQFVSTECVRVFGHVSNRCIECGEKFDSFKKMPICTNALVKQDWSYKMGIIIGTGDVSLDMYLSSISNAVNSKEEIKRNKYDRRNNC